ncbi:ribosome small subunit-dependent GTPase A [candidate division KSB1 bacterium]|nr:ribosome small subunit-dependent GTPase A [candidate division KSB1 bacterium]
MQNELEKLGFDRYFADQLQENTIPGLEPARVISVNRDNYIVRNVRGEKTAELLGRFRFSVSSQLELPAVGDWILIQYFDDNSPVLIHSLLDRKSLLRRKTAGKKVDFQLIAANLDIAFIIQSLDVNFNIARLERYLVMIHESDITPVILLSKADLISDSELEKRIDLIRKTGMTCQVLGFSNKTGMGVQNIRDVISVGVTCCLLGSSGVGKTTLLNVLLGSQIFETNEVRRDGKGRHTTSQRQLISLPNGGMIIDTPGMRELGQIDAEEGVEETFADIILLAAHCRFVDCTHISEPGCAVQAAVKNGQVDSLHYRNFIKLQKESRYYNMSYLEKRQRDREFGKMVQQFKKNYRKK